MTDTYTFSLQGPIVPKARARVTTNGTYQPRKYQDWKQSAIAALREQWQGGPIKQSVSINIELTGKHSRRGDSDNVAGSLMDSLVQAGILLDDNLKKIPFLAIGLYWSKAKPKTTITVKTNA